MKKEEIIEEVGKTLLTPIFYIQLLFALCVIGSPFIWIWVGWELFWRVLLTGLIGFILMTLIRRLVKTSIVEVVDEELAKPKEHRSTFLERLEQKKKERESNKKFVS